MEIRRKERLRWLVSGAAAGLVNGLFGGGGGQILVPLLTRWCGLEPKRAFASCVAVIAPLCAVSGGLYLLRGGLAFSAAWPYLLGGLMGGVIAGRSFKKVPANFLRRLLALLILYGGVRCLFWS